MSSANRPMLAVVHLVVRELGIDFFRQFVASYRQFDAGVDHVLILALKQFDSDEEFLPYRNELSGIAYRTIRVADEGHDIGSYVAVTRDTDLEAYCFVNSKTELCADNWLKSLADGLMENPEGMVGATGSWQSLASDALVYRRSTKPDVLINFRRLLGYLWLLRIFPKFPNPHIRTNVFMVARTVFLSLRFGDIGSKDDTWKLESGRSSISRQIEARGGRLLIVDSKGQTYLPAKWANSGTFWQESQQGLLAKDRQTRIYEAANPAARAAMTSEAWEQPALPHAWQTVIVTLAALGIVIAALYCGLT